MTHYRLKIIQFVIPILALLIVVRLFYWQVVRGEELTSKAVAQHSSVQTLPGFRGDIIASDGSLLVSTETRYLLFAYKPQLEESPSFIIDKISPIIATAAEIASSSAEVLPDFDQRLKSTRALLQEKLNIDRSWVALKHHLTTDQKNQIEALEIKGLGFDEQLVRFYPEASMSAHLLGFVGQDSFGDPKGYFGLEGYYDRQLQGRGGKIRQETDAQGNPILIGNFSKFSSLNGRTLKTTINRSLQYQAQKLLDASLLKYGAVSGSVIIMNSKTGAILALANSPYYDPRIFYKFDSSLHKNPVVADLFEPGSIFKPIIMAAGIDAKVIEPETRCDICASPLVIGQYTIKTWNDEYHPDTTMTEALVHSDNTGMVFVARKLGQDRFLQYLNKFGLSEKTNIDLQEESFGQPKAGSDFREIDLATNSFGQGIALTRIQVMAAINAIANAGVWVRPYIVESVSDGDDESKTEVVSKEVISKEAAQKVTQMMVAAVEEGEAKWAKPKGIKIAGKTGTAQIPVSGHYDEEKTIASFVGFAPADNPKYTMLVTLREPTTSPWGSETAAPLWFDIFRNSLMFEL